MLVAATYMYALYNVTKDRYFEVGNDPSQRSYEEHLHPFSLFESLDEVLTLKAREQQRYPSDTFEVLEQSVIMTRFIP